MRTLIIIPVRDEADALEKLLPSVLAEVTRLKLLADVIVVDDGSSDGSGSVAQDLGVMVLRQESLGKPQAVRRGLEHAFGRGYGAVLIFDGDGQHPVEMISTMISQLKYSAIVKGSRFHPDSPQRATPPDRRELCERIKQLVHQYTDWNITDPQCGLVALRRDAVELTIKALTWTIEWELEFIIWLRSVVQDKCPIQEVPIPAIYEGLPGHKQVAKYDPSLGSTRLLERLPRQTAVIRQTARRFGLHPT